MSPEAARGDDSLLERLLLDVDEATDVFDDEVVKGSVVVVVDVVASSDSDVDGDGASSEVADADAYSGVAGASSSRCT